MIEYMKTLILKFIVIASFALISCTSSKTEVERAITLDLNSGEGILKSIEMITSSHKKWSQSVFDTIHLSIESLALSGELDRNINEDKKHLANLFTSSAALLKDKADSIFRLSEYKGYKQMKSDLNFLKAKHKAFLNIYVDIDENNPQLSFVSDLFKQYEYVLGASRSRFEQKAEILPDYKLKQYEKDAERTKRSIQNNKYYKEYFSNNIEIQKGMSEFPDRMAIAKKQYYVDLEQLVEQTSVTDSLSSVQLLKIQGEFDGMASNIAQDAVDRLLNYVMNYKEPTKNENN